MEYRVVTEFADSQDDYYVYRAGDSFPRLGKQVSEERIAGLLTNANLANVPVIEEVVVERKTTKKAKKE